MVMQCFGDAWSILGKVWHSHFSSASGREPAVAVTRGNNPAQLACQHRVGMYAVQSSLLGSLFHTQEKHLQVLSQSSRLRLSNVWSSICRTDGGRPDGHAPPEFDCTHPDEGGASQPSQINVHTWRIG